MQKIDPNKTNSFDLLRASRIHFIGIGGIGLSAIAKLMLLQDKKVSGSDLSGSGITEKLRGMGADIFIGQKKENLPKDAELVIYTPAIADDNIEMKTAKENSIPLMSYPEALGVLLNKEFGIAICGTHGKSTTTSMIGLVLAGGGLDPSVVVGSKVPEFDGNLRISSGAPAAGRYFVAEACEYKRDFLEYYPKIIVLNNIELDHTDYYRDIEDYRSAFEEFIGHLSDGGVLILNGNDKETLNAKRQMLKQIKKLNIKTFSFGFDESNDVQGYDLKTLEGKTKFKVKYMGRDFGSFELKLPGKFNVHNALAAIAVGMHLGIDVKKIKRSLADFGGIWRRFEIKGEYKPVSALKLWRGKNALVVSDYAHHPTAVRSTIEAAHEFYPGRRIVAVFQPHQHNRTKILYQDFLKSFDSADVLILVEIFDVAGREEEKDQNVSSKKMAEDVKSVILSDPPTGGESKDSAVSAISISTGLPRRSDDYIGTPRNDKKIVFLNPDNIFYAANLAETRKMIDEKIKPGDIVLIMGAGDIYKVADELVVKNEL